VSCSERRLLMLTCIGVLAISLGAAVEDQVHCRRMGREGCGQTVTTAAAAALGWATGVLTKTPD